jgi:hypothetical protein
MFLLGQIQSFGTRLSCVEKFFEERRNDMNCNLLIKQILTLTSEIPTFRNKIAHGLYITDESKSKVYLRTFVTDPRRSSSQPVTEDGPRFFELCNTNILREIEKIHAVQRKNHELLEVFRPHKVCE